MYSAHDIRTAFLEFFTAHDHTLVDSSALLPANDPTLLFTNAGMVQFKDVFTGREERPYHRATSAQKCMRAGGKHNDLENVGRTARHHTFFEMLGNFSFGDYFKQDAIAMAWELLTKRLGIDPQRLWIPVFRDDDEAADLWPAIPGVRADRIVRMDEKDNFWSMGDTGPCGPCSEILIDQGEAFSCGSPDCRVGCDCDRYLELWNLVFMQFNRAADGTLTPLPRPSIDTGMGLERITAVLQGVASNYDTDLFRPIIKHIADVCGHRYGSDPEHDTSMRIIADHSRATAFLIADGILPSNEGRGYVLRRIMRRAARRGRLLGIEKPFLADCAAVVCTQMQPVYPELTKSLDYLRTVIDSEEHSFAETLQAGLKMLAEELRQITGTGSRELPGEVAFRLYDTYGFPLDLTADIAAEQQIRVDEAGFQQAMEQQKQRARRAWKGSGDRGVSDLYRAFERDGLASTFCGYEHAEASATIHTIIRDGQAVPAATAGDEVEIIAAETPFYGESGGQVGDCGLIETDTAAVEVHDTLKPTDRLIIHRGRVLRGTLSAGAAARFAVDADRRGATARYHTATHPPQSVLRTQLGAHVKQAGSLVTPERLRFDFSHFSALDAAQLQAIEDQVNACIRADLPVQGTITSRTDALAAGATALFGEKYGDTVRVVTIGDTSCELCGGTHTRATGEIGLFKIVAESAVAAGVRRIEALTGAAACTHVQQQEALLGRLADTLKTDPSALESRVLRLADQCRALEKENQRLQDTLAARQAGSILDQARDIAGIPVVATAADGHTPKTLREYGDQIRSKMGSGIVVLGTAESTKAHLIAMVTKDLTDRIAAGDIIREIAPLVDGRGGGKPDMAQAGGKNSAGLQAALEHAIEYISRRLAG